MIKTNHFTLLSYDSDNDEYGYEVLLKERRKMDQNKREEKNRKKDLKEIENKKKEDEKYALSLKRTKVRDNLMLVKLIEEDNYDITSYLSLSGDIQCSLNITNMSCALAYGGFTLFNKDEYMRLVEIMEKAKNIYYYDPFRQMKDMMSIAEERMMKCYFSINTYYGYEFAAIYHIYRFLLWDTPNYRRYLKDPRYSYFKGIIDDELKGFIENPYQNHSEIEREYVSKYFEVGKRYYAKRNNFKVLFRNYIRFIGKIKLKMNKIKNK